MTRGGKFHQVAAAEPTRRIDSAHGCRCNDALGVLRSPHEATSPSIASRFVYEGATMSSHTSIYQDKLARLIGTPKTPVLIDVRTDEDFAADPRLIPGAVRRSHQDAADWSSEYSGGSAIVVCMRGAKLAQGTAAWLRHADVSAETLEGGFEGWKRQNFRWCQHQNCPRAMPRAAPAG